MASLLSRGLGSCGPCVHRFACSLVVVSLVFATTAPVAVWGGVPACSTSLVLADANRDRGIDVSDPVYLLGWLFIGGPPPACFDPVEGRRECDAEPSFLGADCNGDGALDISDAVCLLNWLFSGGPAPRCVVVPAPICGDAMLSAAEVCDDGNTVNGDGCNPTCSLTNTTSHFVGTPGVPGRVDGTGAGAQIGQTGGITIAGDVLWLADTANNSIRRIDLVTGVVATVAGDAAGGAPGAGDDPVGTQARFSSPSALATDGITLWIADNSNNLIRAMSLAPPHAVTTVAGSPGMSAHEDGVGPAAQLPSPRGLAFYDGLVYVVDSASATLRRLDPQTGEVVTLAGAPFEIGSDDGFGSSARFMSPRYLAADGRGKVYISDTNGAAIRVFDTATFEVTTFAGTGVPGYADGTASLGEVLVHRPRGITCDGASVYWVESNQHTVRQGIAATTSVSTLAGSHCGGAPMCMGGYTEGVGTMARFSGPFDIAFHGPSGTLLVLDSGNAVMRRIR